MLMRFHNVGVSRARTYVGIAVPVVVLVLLVVAAVFAANRAPDSYPVGSPEATAQAYFQALIDEQPLAIHQLFSDELQDRCDPPTAADVSFVDVSRVTLDQVETDGDSSTVRVSVTQDFGGSPFGPEENTSDETLHLTRIDGSWRISTLPWPFFVCQRKG
jgi:hypothetical protein